MDSTTSPVVRDALPLWKRTLDIFCCLIAMPFLAIVALWSLAVTQIASPGPILFRQERIGRNGRRFFLYKFRTMHVSADVAQHQAHFSQLMKSNEPMVKLDARHDVRLIPSGWLMRASGLDELPQVINILQGDMSIVGPRPCIPYEFDQYGAWQRRRLGNVPGLTGLWQVSGKNRTTFSEMVQLDIAYGEKLSLFQDIGIIFRTIPALWIQVVDTRKSRRAVPQLSAPTAVPAATPVFPSATYAANSRNVINGGPEEPVPFVPARAAMHAYPQSARVTSTSRHPFDRTV